MPADSRRTFDRQICERLLADRRYIEAQNVLGYAASADEVGIDELLVLAMDQGKHVYLPRITANDDLEFARWRAGEALSPGRHGIREPADAPTVPAGRGLIVVPGRAFDASGHRVGRGAGYYDRTLRRLRSIGPSIGVGYYCQVFECVPCESHDVAVDAVLTERGFIR